MSSIFSHAMNAVKSNPHAADKNESYGDSRRDSDSKGSGSILDRIKLNKKPGKAVKTINIHRNSDDDDASTKFGIDTIQRKIIKKDITSLKRPTKKNDSNDMWKHDLYEGPAKVQSITLDCKVFVRNLPDMISSQHLKDLLQNDDEVTGIRMDNGTAEINFSRRDAAQKAADHLNGKTFRGNKLKAAVMGELNASLYNKTSSKRPEREERKQDRDIEERVTFKPKMQSELESDRKPSILSRLKKSNR